MRRRKHHRARTIVFHVDDQSRVPDCEVTIWPSGSGKKVVKGLTAIAILFCCSSSSGTIGLDLADVQKGLSARGLSAADPNNIAGWARQLTSRLRRVLAGLCREHEDLIRESISTKGTKLVVSDNIRFERVEHGRSHRSFDDDRTGDDGETADD